MLKKLLAKLKGQKQIPAEAISATSEPFETLEVTEDEVTRAHLNEFDDPPVLNDLSEFEQQSFFEAAHALKNNKVLNQIFDLVVAKMKDDVWYRTASDNIIYDRFRMKGALEVKEAIEFYASLSGNDDEPYDKFSIAAD